MKFRGIDVRLLFKSGLFPALESFANLWLAAHNRCLSIFDRGNGNASCERQLQLFEVVTFIGVVFAVLGFNTLPFWISWNLPFSILLIFLSFAFLFVGIVIQSVFYFEIWTFVRDLKALDSDVIINGYKEGLANWPVSDDAKNELAIQVVRSQIDKIVASEFENGDDHPTTESLRIKKKRMVRRLRYSFNINIGEEGVFFQEARDKVENERAEKKKYVVT